MTFDDFWRVFPHFEARSKRVMTKAKFDAITGSGLKTTIRDSEGNSMKVELQADPDRIYKAALAYRLNTSDAERKYVPGAQVWLNQGRFEDYSDEQLEDAEKRWARIEQIMTKPKLEVVR